MHIHVSFVKTTTHISNLIFLLIFFLAGCEPKKTSVSSIEKIEKEYKHKSDSLRRAGRYEELISFNFDIIRRSEKENYKDGIIEGYINIANLFSNLKRNKESLIYLDKVHPICESSENYYLKAFLYCEYGNNYFQLGFYDLSKAAYWDAINLSKKIMDEQAKKSMLQYTYACLSFLYQKLNPEKDSFRYYLFKAYEEEPNLILASRKLRYFSKYNLKEDSSLVYFKITDSLLKLNKYPIYQKGIALKNQAVYYIAIKEYSSAIEKLNLAIDIFKKLHRPHDIRDSYEEMYKLQYLVEDSTKAMSYLKSYTELSDSVAAIEKKDLAIPISQMVASQEKLIKNSKYRIYLIMSCGIILLLLLSFIFTGKIKKEKKTNSNLLHEQQIESGNFQKRINEELQTLWNMAKTNDPMFYVKFKEVYPNMHHGLLVINPDLSLSELILCAYIYLGFQSKEIADCTFKSLKTIQNRKNSLRKRLALSSDEDLYVWIKSL